MAKEKNWFSEIKTDHNKSTDPAKKKLIQRNFTYSSEILIASPKYKLTFPINN